MRQRQRSGRADRTSDSSDPEHAPAAVGQGPERRYRLGRWRVDAAARELSDGARTRKLSPRAMAALDLLVAADGQVVRREEFLDAIWPGVTVGEESVTTALSELRRAFGQTRRSAEPGAPMIETVQKSGYRLVAGSAVEVGPDSAAPEAPVLPERDPDAALKADLIAETGADPGAEIEAYAYLIEARRLRERGDADRYERADALCREARGLAPGSALATAQHALNLCYLHLYCGEVGDLREAAALAEAARRARPDLAICHAVEGFVLAALRRDAAARAAFGRALSRDPSDEEAHYLASCGLKGLGDWRISAALSERAAVLRPEDCQLPSMAARAAEAMGDRDRARRNAALGLARVDARLLADPSEPRALSARAALLSILDRRDEVRGNRSPSGAGRGSIMFPEVLGLARIGEHAAALDLLEEVIDAGWRNRNMLSTEPLLASLRAEPRFARIAGRLLH